jgi:hypothetical protein
MAKHFIKPTKEEITCENCSKKFIGGGYINHCPACLWSKHVDLDLPGDRKAGCRGLMKPVEIIIRKREKILIKHKCVKCDKRQVNKISPNDDMEKIIKLSGRHDKHGNL